MLTNERCGSTILPFPIPRLDSAEKAHKITEPYVRFDV
jgi:hypothetical protein